jgi:hypothetical protein
MFQAGMLFVQQHICNLVGPVSTLKQTSIQKHIFYMNDICTIIARDYANFAVHSLMRFYPEVPESTAGISEIWHAGKLCNDLDLNLLTPMYMTVTVVTIVTSMLERCLDLRITAL